MLDHLSIQCSDFEVSAAFYDKVLATLGGVRIMDFGEVIGYGVPPMPDFWLGKHLTGTGFRESHIAFTAADRSAVRAFFDAAVEAGAEVLHEPARLARVPPELLRRLCARSRRQQRRSRLPHTRVADHESRGRFVGCTGALLVEMVAAVEQAIDLRTDQYGDR